MLPSTLYRIEAARASHGESVPSPRSPVREKGSLPWLAAGALVLPSVLPWWTSENGMWAGSGPWFVLVRDPAIRGIRWTPWDPESGLSPFEVAALGLIAVELLVLLRGTVAWHTLGRQGSTARWIMSAAGFAIAFIVWLRRILLVQIEVSLPFFGGTVGEVRWTIDLGQIVMLAAIALLATRLVADARSETPLTATSRASPPASGRRASGTGQTLKALGRR